MKLHWFTPLPPASSDIAMSVARLLPALQARAEVVLWTDAPNVDRALRRRVEVRQYKPGRIRWRELNYADHTLYNVGNDGRFHASILDVAARHPGVVILHDLNVHELALHVLKLGPVWAERYLELMERHEPTGLDDARALVERRATVAELAARHALTRWPLEGAHGVVVHNGPLFRTLCPQIDPPVLDVPLPYLPAAQLLPPVRREGRPGTLELVICGFLNSPNRRLEEVLRALAAFPRSGALLLHIAGHVKDEKALRAHIASLGLRDRVRLHGFMSEADLTALLNRVDMAVNLRNPTRGEASGSQLRFWNHSLPTLVTRTGWYGDQPATTVLHVDPVDEQADLHAHWNRALDDYASLAAVGLAGRERLERVHAAEVFAQALVDFMPLVADYRRRAFAPRLADRAGGALCALGLPETGADTLAQSAAAAIARIARPTAGASPDAAA